LNAVSAERILELVYEVSGLHFGEKKLAFFERRLRERIVSLGLDGVDGYLARLTEDPEEVGELVQTLTTNKTFFMRNPSQFRALREKVLPDIIRARNLDVVRSWGEPGREPAGGRNPSMRIRMWSSGCSTGEEAYTMAFSLLETLQYPRAWDAEIVATDLTRRVLDTAGRGVYGEDSLAELPEYYRDKYMEKVEDGWRVSEAPRGLVRFYESNLKEFMESPDRRMRLTGLDGRESRLDAAGYFDVVFCRNVMIYFDRAGQESLVGALFDSLRPGGALFTGDSEPLHLFRHGFVRADDPDALYYLKPA